MTEICPPSERPSEPERLHGPVVKFRCKSSPNDQSDMQIPSEQYLCDVLNNDIQCIIKLSLILPNI